MCYVESHKCSSPFIIMLNLALGADVCAFGSRGRSIKKCSSRRIELFTLLFYFHIFKVLFLGILAIPVYIVERWH